MEKPIKLLFLVWLHNFNKDWKLNFNTLFKTMKELLKVPNECNQLQMVIGNDLWTKQNLEQIIGEQLSVQGNFKTGQIKHQLFTGVDMENSFTSIHFTFTPATYGSGNLFDFENFDQSNTKWNKY
jgi:iron complex outermembrane receptor protein